MNNFLNVFKRTALALKPRYLIKNYSVAFLFTWALLSSSSSLMLKIFLVITCMVYPFSILIIEIIEEQSLLIFNGSRIYISSVGFIIVKGFIKSIIAYLFGIILAPIGFIYVYVKSQQ